MTDPMRMPGQPAAAGHPPGPSSPARPAELLAPAGSREAAFAAFRYGADAVYAGMGSFSARAEATNLTVDELDELVAFAHAQSPPRRVYVALNTLIQEREVEPAIAALATIHDLEVDAVILQDGGLARLAARHFPGLRRHASTQMAIHSADGVRRARDLGFARVVLARELSLPEIRAAAAVDGIETEMFIHGALCYSYSGLCLMSSHLGGRSANRGRCAYPCRSAWSTREDPHADHLPFSMKDLALLDRVHDLREAGVAALKIEGRMKQPLYGAVVTALYRGLLDGNLDNRERERLIDDCQTVFNRAWTRLHLDGQQRGEPVDPATTGHRGCPLGQVTELRRLTELGRCLVLTIRRPLERHDGIQLELPGHNRRYGLPVAKLAIAAGQRWLPDYQAAAGATVAIPLPDGHPEIPLGTTVYCSSSQAVKRSWPYELPRAGQYRIRLPIAVAVELAPTGLQATATLQTGTGLPTAAVAGRRDLSLAPAKQPDAATQAIRSCFERLGNTRFALAKLTVANPAHLFVPASALNDLRRELCDSLERQVTMARQARLAAIVADHAGQFPPPTQMAKQGKDAGPTVSSEPLLAPPAQKRQSPADFSAPCFSPESWSLKLEADSPLLDAAAAAWPEVELVATLSPRLSILPAAIDQLLAAGRPLRLALPPIIRDHERAAILQQMASLCQRGCRRWELANLAHWPLLDLASEHGIVNDLSVDWPLYTLNRLAAHAWLATGVGRFILSPEDDRDNLVALAGQFDESAGVIVYQHTPLFVAEVCPQAALAGSCRGCDCTAATAQREFRNQSGQRLLATTRNGRTVVADCRPFSLARHLADLRQAGLRHFRVDLQHAPAELLPAKVADLLRHVAVGHPTPGAHDGNYRRQLR